MAEREQQTRLARPSRTLDLLISQRLTNLAALFPGALPNGVEPITAKLWFNALKFLMPSQLNAAFDCLESDFIPTAACPFPVPANLLKFVQDAEENKEKIEAEQAWEDAEVWLSRWFEDCRDKEYPLMDPRIRHSLAAAGGMSYVKNCPIKEYAWAKKRFIEAYLGMAKAERDQPLLGGPVITQLKSIGEGKLPK